MKTLYKKDTKGKVRYLKVWNDREVIFNESGLLDTDSPVTHTKVAKPKNVGRANETTAEQQAESEVKSYITKKLREGYFTSLDDLESTNVLLPMLAKDYEKEKHKIDWGKAYAQPKLDGCFVYGSLVDTDRGLIPIGKIVDENLELNVKSFNFDKNIVEYKPVVNRFNNGVGDNEFLILKFSTGSNVTCTKNHKIYTKDGWKKAEDLKIGDYVKVLNKEHIYGSLLGCLLGDGNINKDKRTKRSYTFSFSHGKEQYTYGEFKANFFNNDYNVYDRVSGYGSEIKNFHIKNISDYYNFIELLIDNDGNRKFLDYKFLRKYLDKQGLAFWIGDDGSIRYNNNNKYTPILSLHTQGYSELQVDEFVKYFKKEHDCTPTKILDKRKGFYFLTFNTKDTLFIMNKLRHNVPNGVEYKFVIKDDYLEEDDYNFDYKKITCISEDSRKYTKYDIEVEDNHNYYVNNILVHNCRALAFIKDGEVKLMSRKGVTIENMKHIEESLIKLYGKADVVLDGELYVHGEGFQTNMSYIKKYRKGFSERIKYNVYDIADENLNQGERRELLSDLKTDDNIVIVNSHKIENEEALKEFHSRAISNGYEGSMVRWGNTRYKNNGRSSNLLKYKDFIDSTAVIIDIVPADQRPDHGVPVFDGFKAGVRMTHEERIDLLTNKEKYIGKTAELRYFELTDDGLPRFPVCVGIRLDK